MRATEGAIEGELSLGGFQGEGSPGFFHEDGLDEAAEEDFFENRGGDACGEDEDDFFEEGVVGAAEELEGGVDVFLAIGEVGEDIRDDVIHENEDGIDDKEAEEAPCEASGDFAEAESKTIKLPHHQAGGEEEDDGDGNDFGEGSIGDLKIEYASAEDSSRAGARGGFGRKRGRGSGVAERQSWRVATWVVAGWEVVAGEVAGWEALGRGRGWKAM